VVLFMTAPGAADVPGGADSLACLLPFGTATFAERLMNGCAQAGLREIDLVVSENPERLRERLGDGSQWGLRLAWHLAKETATPYTVLQSLGLAPGQRVLIGHGHRWVAQGILHALVQEDRVAIAVAHDVRWTGWLSMDAASLHALAPHADFEALAGFAMAGDARHRLIAQPCEFAPADSARELLQAQRLVLQDIAGDAVPASWRRMPWGAMSPDAIVHPQARLAGPVLVGAGCTVGRDARIGPNAVLSQDVLVADGAVVRDALVLPNTYVGGSVTLEHAVAQGNAVQNLKWSVRVTLPQEDAMLTPLVSAADVRASWWGRLVALWLALLAAPLFALLVALQALRGRPLRWQSLLAVTRRAEGSGQLHTCRVRQARPDGGRAGWLLGCYGALLDVVQGRRNWFGIRPRNASQWYALGRDWQILFGRTAMGFFHAPAWVDGAGAPDSESLAAADAYFAVRAGPRERLRILASLVRARRPASPPA
jgi:NDP-sugar pyrophosphorylase family protein